MAIRHNNVKVYDPPAAQMTLDGGESKSFPLVMVDLRGSRNEVKASILADIGNFIKESNESNNSAEFTIKGECPH